MNPGPPALEASTIPLGYRGGGNLASQTDSLLRSRFVGTEGVLLEKLNCFYFLIVLLAQKMLCSFLRNRMIMLREIKSKSAIKMIVVNMTLIFYE